MLKIILLGDCRVGKSSLVDRYGCKDGTDSEYDISGSSSFESNYNPTVGVKFYTTSYRGESVQFWDCSGHDSFASLRASHFKEAHGYKRYYYSAYLSLLNTFISHLFVSANMHYLSPSISLLRSL